MRERLELLRAVCTTVYEATSTWSSPIMGCRSCDWAPSTAPAVAVRAVARPLITAFTGSFSRSGADEALVITKECQPPSVVIGLSSLHMTLHVLERSPSGWRFTNRVDGAIGCDRQMVLRDGRTALVCIRWENGKRQGIDIVDFGTDEPMTTLVDWRANDHLAICDAGPSSYSVAQPAGQLQVLDIDGDGANDLDVAFKVETLAQNDGEALRALPDYALRCACSRAANRGEFQKVGCECPTIQWTDPTPRTFRLQFLSTDHGVVPTDSTRAFLEEAAELGL
jgi:hypothetical protein